MTRPIAIAGLLILALSPLAHAATGVRIEGTFVRAGTFTEVTQVEKGQPVQLIVRVQDISDNPKGVAGGMVDVTWNAAVLDLQDNIDGSNVSTADVAPLFNDAVWTLFYSGVMTATDTLEDMGAGQGVPPKLSLGDAEVFFTLNFSTIGTGQAGLELTGHDFGLIVTDTTEAEAEQHVEVSPALKVVPTGTSEPGDSPGSPTPTPPAAGCFGPGFAVGLLMLAGCSRTFGSRRRPRR
ncbi:MAG: hypothetical protein JXQ73_16760 [Phycisphaerae bacterium]|nr:hypothetical protein [Phycisphaerae bacterium]